jgi:nitrite reductase/ring-hydroxylating ferredoxin subunit
VGVDHTFDHEGPEDWTDVVGSGALAEGEPAVARAGDDDVLLVRRGAEIDAIADRCSHLGGPLHEGEVADGCVTCPWHASTFRLADGEVVHGPANAPQPRYDTREVDGRVELRRHAAG